MASPKQKAGALAAAISAAFVIVAPLTMQSEGKRNQPYRDPVGILTVCYGSTKNVQNRRYSDEECGAILQRDFGAHAEGVIACSPDITARPFILAASTDFAFNSGVSTFCKSSMARLFNRGKWAEGCRAFLKYRFARDRRTGKLLELKGLVRRRKAETELCLRGI